MKESISNQAVALAPVILSARKKSRSTRKNFYKKKHNARNYLRGGFTGDEDFRAHRIAHNKQLKTTTSDYESVL
jgi:hypothetical protein